MSERTLQKAGPLLSQLLRAQRKQEKLAGYPTIVTVADAAISAARGIDGCLIWPVGAAAERVAGAITVRSNGAAEVAACATPVAGRRILLLGSAAVSALALQTTADQLRRRGAAEVHACAVDVPGAEGVRGFDSFQALGGQRRSLLLVGDAA